MNQDEQLTLAIGCPNCGSDTHDGCGYDPDGDVRDFTKPLENAS